MGKKNKVKIEETLDAQIVQDVVQLPDDGTIPKELFRRPAVYRERLKELLSNPNIMDIIVAYVSSGGSLPELCRTWDVSYGHIATWIVDDSERSRKLFEASKARDEWCHKKVLNELQHIALADVRLIFDDTGAVKPIKDWPDSITRAVASVEIFEEFAGRGEDRALIGYTKKIKFWDKVKSLELLAKNLGMLVERHKHEGTVRLEDLVAGGAEPEVVKTLEDQIKQITEQED